MAERENNVIDLMDRNSDRQWRSAVSIAADEEPEDAARAIELTQGTGVPPASAYENLDDFEHQQKLAMSNYLVGQDPFLQEYIKSHPLSSKISSDDWGNMSKASTALQNLSPGSKIFEGALEGGRKAIEEARDEAIGQPLISDEDRRNYPQLTAALDKALKNPILYTLATIPRVVQDVPNIAFKGALGAAHGASLELAKALGLTQPEQFANTIAGMAEYEAYRGHELVEPSTLQAIDARAQKAMQLAKPYLDANKEVPRGLDPLIDQIHGTLDKLDGDKLKEALKAVQQTNTFNRSPEFTREQFVKQYPNSRVEIPAEKVRQLYGDKSPAPDDGLLGWVPNLREQLEAAAQTGGDIEIPRDLWLTKVDPEVAKALEDHVRVRPGALTKEEQGEALKPTELKVEPGREVTPEVDGLRNVANFDDMDRKLGSPVEEAGLGFKGIIPEGAQPQKFKLFDKSANATAETTSAASFKLKDVLDNLPKDNLLPESKVLSDFFGSQLKRLVGDMDVHVLPDKEMDLRRGEGTQGTYFSDHDHIVLRQSTIDGTQPGFFATHVVMHEAAHAITAQALRNFPVLAEYARRLMLHTSRVLKDTSSEKWLEHFNAFRNEREFIAEAIGNTNFQDLLHHIPTTEKLQQGLRIKAGSMWDAVREIVKDAWTRIFKNTPSESVMDAVFRMQQAFEDINIKLKDASGLVGRSLREELGENLETTPKLSEEGAKEAFEAKALGMSVKRYRNFKELALAKKQEDIDFAAKEQQKLDEQRLSQNWKDNEAGVRDLVKDQLSSRPDLAADTFLRSGQLFNVKYRRTRLDKSYLTDEQLSKLDPEHYGEKGLKPDDLANILGYQSGDQLVSALSNLKTVRDREGLTPSAHLKQLEDVMVEREMRDRYGSLAEQKLNAAQDHVLGATQYEILSEQVLHYAEKLGQQLTLDKGALQAQARSAFAGLRAGSVTSTKLFEQMGRQGRKIEQLDEEGKFDEAFKLAQERQSTFLQAREATKFEREFSKFDKRAGQFRMREPKVVNIEHSNAIQDILKRSGYTVNRSLEDIEAEYEKNGPGTLAKWLQSKDMSNIIDPDPDFPQQNRSTYSVDPRFLDPKFSKKIEDGTVEEARSVINSVESLYANGKAETKGTLGGHDFQRDELVKNLVSIMRDVANTPVKGIKRPEQTNAMQTLWVGLLQMESIWQRLARGDPDNPFMKYINGPTMSAGNFRDELQRDYSRRYRGIGEFGDPNKKVANSLFFEPDLSEGEDSPVPRDLTMRNIYAMVSNVGNWSNHDKLTRGAGMENKIAEEWRKTGYKMAMNDPVMNMLFANTKKEDWDRAQALGKIFEALFEHSERVYYDLGSRPGARIELRPIETPFGTYEGWYHPVIYDSARPAMYVTDPDTGETKKVGGSKKLAGPNPLDEGGFYQVQTSAAYQKGRTGYAAPLELNFDTVPYRLKQMINDIAMRPVVTELNKIFKDDRFRQAMTQTLGKHYTDLLTPYLRDIAGQRRFTDQIQSTGGRIVEYIYSNLVATLIGFNPGTVLKHFPTALNNSLRGVDKAEFAKEFASMWLTPQGWANVRTILEKSSEVARRARNWRETVSGAQEELFPGLDAPLADLMPAKAAAWLEKTRQAMTKAGASPVAWSDMASVAPLWNMVYKREIRAGKLEGDAIDAADFAIRQAHGSTAVTARPYYMRGGAAVRAVMPFYTFFNDMLQRQYETAWRAKDLLGGRVPDEKRTEEMGKIAFGIWAYFLFPALVEQAVSPIVFNKQSYLTMGADIIGTGLSSSFPIIRQLVHDLTTGQESQQTIYGTGGKAVVDFAKDISNGKQTFTKDRAGKFIKHTATMIGATLGLANSQMGRWGEGVYNVNSGVQRPRDAGDWWQLFRFGDMKAKEKDIINRTLKGR